MSGDTKLEASRRRSAWRFILLVGVTGLFADMTHEGARGVTGDFLGRLGASGANVTSDDRRSTAYGVFDTIYSVAWLAGSAALGVLYDHYIWGLVALSVGAQIAAIPVFFVGASNSSIDPKAPR